MNARICLAPTSARPERCSTRTASRYERDSGLLGVRQKATRQWAGDVVAPSCERRWRRASLVLVTGVEPHADRASAIPYALLYTEPQGTRLGGGSDALRPLGEIYACTAKVRCAVCCYDCARSSTDRASDYGSFLDLRCS